MHEDTTKQRSEIFWFIVSVDSNLISKFIQGVASLRTVRLYCGLIGSFVKIGQILNFNKISVPSPNYTSLFSQNRLRFFKKTESSKFAINTQRGLF